MSDPDHNVLNFVFGSRPFHTVELGSFIRPGREAIDAVSERIPGKGTAIDMVERGLVPSIFESRQSSTHSVSPSEAIH